MAPRCSPSVRAWSARTVPRPRRWKRLRSRCWRWAPKKKSRPIAVPGLGFSLTLQAHVPWSDEAPEPGLELQMAMPDSLEVGKAAELKVTVAAPASQATALRVALPAGVQADRPTLDQLVASGRVL